MSNGATQPQEHVCAALRMTRAELLLYFRPHQAHEWNPAVLSPHIPSFYFPSFTVSTIPTAIIITAKIWTG